MAKLAGAHRFAYSKTSAKIRQRKIICKYLRGKFSVSDNFFIFLRRKVFQNEINFY